MKLAPSLLSADFAHLLDEAQSVAPLASRLHWDVMDGHFVPNLTFGPPVVNALRRRLDLPFEIHLMIDRPAEYALQFDVHPGDCIIFHVEALDSAERAIAAIRQTGASVGVSLRPGTSLDRIAPLLDDVSVALVMSVEPGFGGQPFRPDALERIRDLSRRIGSRAVDLAVDGGVHVGNVAGIVAAGAEILVAGSAIFAARDRLEAMRALLEAAR
jgi:ribulose-phosphate 3-epimerase